MDDDELTPEDNESLEERLKSLELKSNRKDIWDIIRILTSFLIPLSIFFGTFLLSRAEREAQIQNDTKEIKLAELRAKIDQAQLVSTFLEALVDTDSYKRQLAIKSILLALPEKGQEIVQVVSENDPDRSIQEYAKETLDQSREQERLRLLIADLYSLESNVRQAALSQLVSTWKTNEWLVKELTDYAYQPLTEIQDRKVGHVNTVSVLNTLSPQLLQQNREAVQEFIAVVEAEDYGRSAQRLLDGLKGKVQ